MQDINLNLSSPGARIATVVFLALSLAACGGGGGEESAIAAPPPGGGGGGGGGTPPPIDNIAPSVAITSPDDDGSVTVTGTSVTLSGEASDNVGVQGLSWSNNRGGAGTIAVGSAWQTAAIALQDGTNVITVEAEDAAGNKSQDQIVVLQSAGASPDDAVAMISYSSNLTGATQLQDATVQRTFAYLFFEPGQTWENLGVTRIDFYCCKALTGAADAHLPRIIDTTDPFVLGIDLGQFEAGTRRELYIDVYFENGTQDNVFVEFQLEGGSNNGNAAPSISGFPPTQVTAGQFYDFTPAANDPDGDVLTFQVQNLPSWASFDTQTGRLSGTPVQNDAGSYNNVQIGVSDGQQTSTLAPFSITVSAVANASLTINWTPPTQNVDGSPVVGLAGFKIFYGQSSGSYPNVIDVNNGGLTSYTVENLTPGTWYLAMTATDSSGLESALSYEITKNAQ
ncbi:MAG: putative Ig domain-containing protein [Pseudomonadota bacterium]